VTYTDTIRDGASFELTNYVDETFPPAKGQPLQVVKTWLVGSDPIFKSRPLLPASPQEAQYWWGDRSRPDLAQYWHSAENHAWVYDGPQQMITARFGVVNVDKGDLIGGEARLRPQATAWPVSPITGNIEVKGPPPPDATTSNPSNGSTQPAASGCPTFAGIQTTPTSDGGCLFKSPDGSGRTDMVPNGWKAYDGTFHPAGMTMTVSQLTLYPAN
jgi:hypothetical protein